MKELDFWGTKVIFPFDPYPAQEIYIQKCIEALKGGQNAVLESPTGTGKTLCLLTAVLSFRHEIFADVKRNLQQGDATSHMAAVPGVIYASRTHSQLSQVVKELKRLQEHGYQIKMSVLGGRATTCSHSYVSKEKNSVIQQSMCRAYCKAHKCHYKNVLDSLGEVSHESLGGVVDIEELVSFASKKGACPYYLGRQLAEKSEILLIPYNYLLDEKLRRRHKIEVSNKIIIVDEAHNVESVCEESASITINSTDLAGAIQECDDVAAVHAGFMDPSQNYLQAVPDSDNHRVKELQEVYTKTAMLKDGLIGLEKTLIQNFSQYSTPSGSSVPPSQLYHTFKSAGFISDSPEHATQFYALIEIIKATLSESPTSTKGQKLNKIMEITQFFSSFGEEMLEMEIEKYMLFIKEEDDKAKRKKDEQLFKTLQLKDPIEINLWCFDASKSIETLMRDGARNMIFTSGTLSPLDEYILNLGLHLTKTEPVKLIGEHVVGNDQLYVATLAKTEGGSELKNVFKNREDASMFKGMGAAVSKIKNCTPGGLLIFHPTYTLMNIANNFWQTREPKDCANMSANMFKRKVFNEPSNRSELEQMSVEFESEIAVNPARGAIFQGVCRGKASEGVDFADDKGRVVVITGIPYAPMMDPRVKLKKEFLTRRKQEKRGHIGGDEWYQIQAVRAVNQAIGRIIRHKHDFGAIIFMDSRFTFPNTKALLPSWVAPHLVKFDCPKLLSQSLRAFFNKMAAFQRKGILECAKPISTIAEDKSDTRSREIKAKRKILEKNDEVRKAAAQEKMKMFKSEQAYFLNGSASNMHQMFHKSKVSMLQVLDEDLVTNEKTLGNNKGTQHESRKSAIDDSLNITNANSLKRSQGEVTTPKSKRKKIRIVRATDELDLILKSKTSAESQTQEGKCDERLFKIICFDIREELDSKNEHYFENEAKEYLKTYLKFSKTVFFRGGIAADWADFRTFVKSILISPDADAHNSGWEKWFQKLSILGSRLRAIIIVGSLYILRKRPRTKVSFTSYLEKNFTLHPLEAGNWVITCGRGFEKSSLRFNGVKKGIDKTDIDQVTWAARNYFGKYLVFLKFVVGGIIWSDIWTEMKSTIANLFKARSSETIAKLFKTLKLFAMPFSEEKIDRLIMIGITGALVEAPEVHEDYIQHLNILYAGVSEEERARTLRTIFNYKASQ